MSLEDDVRARLHLEGPLPSGACELIYVPTFHASVGLRIAGAHVEVWTEDSVAELNVSEVEPIATRLATLDVGPSMHGGRDGLWLFVRNARGSATYATTDEWNEWLEAAARVLEAMPAKEELACLRPVAGYLRRPPRKRDKG